MCVLKKKKLYHFFFTKLFNLNKLKYTRFHSITDCFYCMFVKEIKIFFNLILMIILLYHKCFLKNE